MLELDHEENSKAGVDPGKLTLGSNKLVHWICCKCPRGRLHRWQASLASRCLQGSNCPCCSSKQVCLCNSLQWRFPALAREWDSAKNGVETDQVIAQCHTMAFWKDKEGRTWEQTPFARVDALKQKDKRASSRLKREQTP